MIVGSRQRLGKIDDEAEIKLGDNKIKKVSETKTLGVIVDDQLKWNSHINTVATKVSKGIGMTAAAANRNARSLIRFNYISTSNLL